MANHGEKPNLPIKVEVFDEAKGLNDGHKQETDDIHRGHKHERSLMADAVMGKLDKNPNKLVKVDEELHEALNKFAKLLNLDPNSYSDKNGQMKYEMKDKNGRVKYWAAYHPKDNTLELVSVDSFLAVDVKKSGKNEVKLEEHGDNPNTKAVITMNVKTRLASMSLIKNGKKEVQFANKTVDQILADKELLGKLASM